MLFVAFIDVTVKPPLASSNVLNIVVVATFSRNNT